MLCFLRHKAPSCTMMNWSKVLQTTSQDKIVLKSRKATSSALRQIGSRTHSHATKNGMLLFYHSVEFCELPNYDFDSFELTWIKGQIGLKLSFDNFDCKWNLYFVETTLWETKVFQTDNKIAICWNSVWFLFCKQFSKVDQLGIPLFRH